jgi:hypothetical protein
MYTYMYVCMYLSTYITMMCTGRYTVIHSGVLCVLHYVPVYPDWVHVKKVETENKIKRAVRLQVQYRYTSKLPV